MLGPQTQHKGAVYLSYVLLVAKGGNFLKTYHDSASTSPMNSRLDKLRCVHAP